MRVVVAFGKTGLAVELPQGPRYLMLEARSAQPLADWQGEIETALRAPLGTPPLEEMARGMGGAGGNRTAAISICDITRPAPNPQTLPRVLGALERGGIRSENIAILIATGLHRAATEAEIRQICGAPIAVKYHVLNHDARNFAQHRYLGRTASGTPAYIDERFLAADLHITLGFIEPHLMLGFSGGRKLIAPGLAAQETIKVLHSPKFMRDGRATEGSTTQNPLHHELLEIARMARHDFILDVALARDRSIAGVFAGDPEKAHRRGVEFVSGTLLETLEEPVDAAITSGAGYPLDLTFYQAVKGITAAAHIVKPGGRILVMAACEEGAGAPEFRQMLLTGTSDAGFLKQIAGAPVNVDQWQLEKLALVTTEKRLFYYVPGLPVEYQAKLWGRSFATPQSAVEAALEGLPEGARVAVIPEGPYVLANCCAAGAPASQPEAVFH
jgi:lactate racemase